MPTPCSAEIVPPRPAAAVEHLGRDRLRVAGVEHVDVDVALGEVAERHDRPPCAASGAADARHQLVERADRHGDVELERHALAR